MISEARVCARRAAAAAGAGFTLLLAHASCGTAAVRLAGRLARHALAEARRPAFLQHASLVAPVASYLTSVPAPRTRLAINSPTPGWLRRLCSMLVLVARRPPGSYESLRGSRGRFRPPPPSPSTLSC